MSPIHFFTSDIFDIPVELADTPPLIEISKVTEIGQLRGAISHFYTGALFHLFDEPTQYQLACRVASLLKLQPGSVIFGRHQGLPEECYIDDHMGRIRYGHSPASWPKLWEKVFTELVSADFAENHVKVEASLTEGFNTQVFQARHQTNMLIWSVSII
ncbi:hypothetical protein QCA50_020771 [Cerrena zonata]|uniref:Uncharacterized protein n=1 Tax=Cerrena zonata TaxID=2478898 RepID=A0AAW0FI26_9APHY